jgi:hypothetical protein
LSVRSPTFGTAPAEYLRDQATWGTVSRVTAFLREGKNERENAKHEKEQRFGMTKSDPDRWQEINTH